MKPRVVVGRQRQEERGTKEDRNKDMRQEDRHWLIKQVEKLDSGKRNENRE